MSVIFCATLINRTRDAFSLEVTVKENFIVQLEVPSDGPSVFYVYDMHTHTCTSVRDMYRCMRVNVHDIYWRLRAVTVRHSGLCLRTVTVGHAGLCLRTVTVDHAGLCLRTVTVGHAGLCLRTVTVGHSGLCLRTFTVGHSGLCLPTVTVGHSGLCERLRSVQFSPFTDWVGGERGWGG